MVDQIQAEQFIPQITTPSSNQYQSLSNQVTHKTFFKWFIVIFILSGLVLSGVNLFKKSEETPTTLTFYKYAATVMGMKVVNPSGNPISALEPLLTYSPSIIQWKTFRSEYLGYEIKYPPELSERGDFFYRKNLVAFGYRIGVIDPQSWNVFEDKEIGVTPSGIKELTINGVKVKYGEFIRYEGKNIKDYFFIYQYLVGQDLVHFVFNFINSGSLSDSCSLYVEVLKRGIKNAPPGYPGNVICKDDLTPKTINDYKTSFKTEINLFNQMATTIRFFPRNLNPQPVRI